MYVIFVAYLWIVETHLANVGNILVLVGGLALLLSVWNNGRESIKKKRKKELEKMKLRDIK
jgi:hypothetical protein